MKLAFIGGGGVRTVFFCQSIKKYVKVFGISELSLMDNDPEKLYTFGALAKYACSDVKELNITLTTSVEEAVTGADYVVTAIRVGGDHGRVIDERTALDMGILGQETTGAGGFAYAMRTIPVLLDYMRIIAEKSNHATVFHFTNPAGLVIYLPFASPSFGTFHKKTAAGAFSGKKTGHIFGRKCVRKAICDAAYVRAGKGVSAGNLRYSYIFCDIEWETCHTFFGSRC